MYQVFGTVIVGIVTHVATRFKLENHARGILFGVVTGMAGYFGAFAFLYAISRVKHR